MSMQVLAQKAKEQSIPWNTIQQELHDQGFAMIRDFQTPKECHDFMDLYDQREHFRKTITMERYRFGKGEYKYFSYPLPLMIESLREELYPYLVPVANAWMRALKINKSFPATLKELLEQCHQNHQLRPTPLILKYGKGDYNTLHQDLYGDVFFPIQAVFFLNVQGKDYTGGEFVLTEQRPRAQSKAIVLQPGQGDLLFFTTSFRPVKGTKGYYRVNMKHGVSEVHEGERYALGIIFHDAR